MRIKFFLFLLIFMALPTVFWGQVKIGKVGINNNNSNSYTENLDVNGVFRIRKLEGTGVNKNAFIYTKSDGTASQQTDQVFVPSKVLVADQNGVVGVAPNLNPPFFYLPAFVMPLKAEQVDGIYSKKIGDVFTIDLYKIYQDNFGDGVLDGGGIRNESAGSNIVTFNAGELEYFITYFDDSLFTNLEIASNGRLTYEVTADYSTKMKSFMNIIFKTKSPF